MRCADCHDAAADAPRAGHAACAPCHAIGGQEGKSCELCHASAAGGASYPGAPAGAPASDLRFSHRRHLTRGGACDRCHPGVAGAARLDPAAHRPSMESCVECHRGLGARAADCGVCHERITAATRPASHDPRWMVRHGAESRERPTLCAACHATADCVRCHQEIPPRDHTEFWLRRGHGLESRWDRERCLACHREDACVECHRVTRPVNHGSGWAAPTFRHCQRCHYPLEDTSCAVCHEHAHPLPLPFGPRG